MDRRIRRYIRAKQTLIKLLEEQKQTIVHRAVTRGLDPNVRLKPSGVEWLGDVPEHWVVMPLRRVTVSRCDGPFGSGLKSLHYTDQGIRVVRLQNIGHAEFKDRDAAFISPSHYAILGDHTVEAGDLLIAGLGDERHPAGRACVAPSFIIPAMVKADCFRFRLCRQRLDPEFAALHLTATAVNASTFLSTGATRQRINLQAMASRTVAVPSMQEQLAIVQHITNETSASRLAISNAQRAISLLREYRTRLIADVVTGKLDVCEAAACLSDEAEEPEPLDDAEALSDTDAEAADDLDAAPEEDEP
jgi:type I restriction enzyme S subunit